MTFLIKIVSKHFLVTIVLFPNKPSDYDVIIALLLTLICRIFSCLFQQRKCLNFSFKINYLTIK